MNKTTKSVFITDEWMTQFDNLYCDDSERSTKAEHKTGTNNEMSISVYEIMGSPVRDQIINMGVGLIESTASALSSEGIEVSKEDLARGLLSERYTSDIVEGVIKELNEGVPAFIRSFINDLEKSNIDLVNDKTAQNVLSCRFTHDFINRVIEIINKEEKEK